MPEYINRNDLLRGWNGVFFDEEQKALIRKMPAAEVAPVRHGRWIEHVNEYENWCECSECKYMPDSPLDETPYCPFCGAKMDLEP